MKVIIVDSDRVSLRIWTEALKAFFPEIHQAKNGQEAINILKDNPQPFDLAIIHQWLSDMLGKEICQLIKAKNPKARVIALNADPLGYKPEDAKAEGFDDCLLIPASAKKLLEVVFG